MKRNNKKGYVTVFLALAMPLIISVLGFCIDGGMMLYFDARLSTAVKFACISASSDNENIDGNLVIKAENSFVEEVLHENLKDAILVDFMINPSSKNECTVKGSYKIEFVFMKLFGITEKSLTESYTARRT